MITDTIGHAEAHAGIGAPRDGLGLASLLGADAGIGACRVDQAHHRQREAVGHLHQPLRLAVALRPRHAEIVLDPAFGVGALFVPDDHRRAALEPSDAADDRLVLAEVAVAGERREILHQPVDIVAEMRPLGMPGDLRLLPGGELRIGLLQRLLRLGLELGELLLDGHRALLGGERFELGDLAFKLGNRLFEIEISAHLAEGGPSDPSRAGCRVKARRERALLSGLGAKPVNRQHPPRAPNLAPFG